MSQWNRLSAVLSPIWSPFVILIGFHQHFFTIPTAGFLSVDLPILAVLVFIGIILAFIIFFTTEWERPPRYNWVRRPSFRCRLMP